MAYYAFLNVNNIVTEVISGKHENEDGVDWEVVYGNFRNQVCKRTSYNTRGGVHYIPNSNPPTPSPDQSQAFRANYAGIGYTYDLINDVFYAAQPYPSWTISAPTWEWKPPVPYPTDGNQYIWDESTLSWSEFTG